METEKKNEENKNVLVHREETQDGVIFSQKIPKIPLEVLVGGREDEKEKVDAFLDELHKQVAESKETRKSVRILYHRRKENMTEEQQDEWLRDKANSVYMVFAPKDRKVSGVYIKTLVKKIKEFEKSLRWFKQKVELKSKYLAKKEVQPTVVPKPTEEKPKRKPRKPKTEK